MMINVTVTLCKNNAFMISMNHKWSKAEVVKAQQFVFCLDSRVRRFESGRKYFPLDIGLGCWVGL